MLTESFPHCYSDCAKEEVVRFLEEERIALVALEGDRVVGFVGAIPQYGRTGFELHPLMVAKDFQSRGMGTALVKALEKEVRDTGGLLLYLGCDDEFHQTSLSDTDLFVDTFGKIERIENLSMHPFSFYQKVGFTIVGVIPDANGVGKPDIIMAKRVALA